MYTRERVRTRYGTATFSMRAANEYCDDYPDADGRFKPEVIMGEAGLHL